MKKNRIFAVAGVALLATGVLAACGSSKSSNAEAPKAYGYTYTADPETLDYLISGKQSTKVATSNGIDGLFTNDKYGNLTPAVAEDWSVSQDGLTYTYKIRKGEQDAYLKMPIGMILYDKNENITWINPYLQKKLQRQDVIGISLKELNERLYYQVKRQIQTNKENDIFTAKIIINGKL